MESQIFFFAEQFLFCIEVEGFWAQPLIEKLK
jgi:hypothetical protein